MIGFISGITVLFCLLCATLLGEAQNYPEREHLPNGPGSRSFNPPLKDPYVNNQNRYNHRQFTPSYAVNTNYPPPRQYRRNDDYGFNPDRSHNHDMNYGARRWDHPSSNNQYSGSYNDYYLTEFPSTPYRHPTERIYPFGYYFTEKSNVMTTKKPLQTTTAKPSELHERSDFNISSEQVSHTRNTIKRKSEDYDAQKMADRTKLVEPNKTVEPNKMVDPIKMIDLSKMVDPDKMIYPNESPNIKPLNPKHIPQNCTYGLCNTTVDYPSEIIQRIIDKSKELKQYFQGLGEIYEYKPTIIDFQNRFGGAGETLCSTTKRTEFPQTAINTDQVEQYIVNIGDYKQGVVVETCERDGDACMFAESFPDGYIATCEQKYSIKRLMTAKKESEQLVFDNFRLPSCCVCTVIRGKT